MEFVQIIEYSTTKPDEMQAAGEAYRASREDTQDSVKVVVTQDRDRENTYVMVVRFPSYEAAMENSQREDTTELSQKMASLCDGPPSFRNLDVLMDM
ncbi:MAG: hypothetical protein QOG43_1073 [Actinomycetota bacterium]|jgi:quinol monooxygenase YgiN|nr:hypothetical protein [Actinomycetota bacterium]